MNIKKSIKKSLSDIKRRSIQIFGHMVTLSFRKKTMILCLLLVCSSFYLAPIGMLVLCLGLIFEWKNKKQNDKLFWQCAKNSIIFYPGLIFLLSAIIGPLFFKHYINSLLGIVVLAPVLLGAFLIEVLWKKEDALHFSRYTSIVLIPISIYAFLIPWSSGSIFNYSGVVRIAGTFSNPNYFSYVLELILIFSLALYYHIWKNSSKIWLVISFITGLVSLYFTGSRTGMLAFILGVTVFYLCMSEKAILVIVFGTLTIVLGFTAIFPEQSVMIFKDIIPRPDTFLNEIRNRFMLWDVALKQITRNPFLGTGLDSYHYYIPKNAPAVLKTTMHSHNIFINLWLETGILGIASFIWIFMRAIIGGIKNLKNSSVRPYLSAGVGMVVVSCIHGVMDAPLVSSQTLALYGIFIACFIVMQRKNLEV